jgi:hypothetical protein
MSLTELFVIAVAGFAMVAASRVVKARHAGAHIAEGGGRLVFLLTLLLGPPIVLGALFHPSAGPLGWVVWVPVYVVMLVGLTILALLALPTVLRVAPPRSHGFLSLALAGGEGEPEDLPFDPPVAPALAVSMALVDRTNSVFPRGAEFPNQIDRAGFRTDWDALDAATCALEDGIAGDVRLGEAVASAAKAMARDARSRLECLRRLSLDHGQVWASGSIDRP